MDGWKLLLGDVAEILRQNRWLARLAAALAVMAAAALAVSCAARVASPAQQEAATGAATAGETAAATPTEGQDEARAAWTSAESSLWEELETYRWIAADGSWLEFGETGWTDGDGQATAAALTSASVGESETQSYSDNADVSATTQVTTFSLLLGDGSTTIGRLTEVTTTSGTTRDVAIDSVSTSKAFTAWSRSSELAVEDAYGDLAALFGGSTDGLTEALRSWASENAPDATKATWDGASTTDRRLGSVKVALELDDAAGSRVTATYVTDSGSIDVKGE